MNRPDLTLLGLPVVLMNDIPDDHVMIIGSQQPMTIASLSFSVPHVNEDGILTFRTTSIIDPHLVPVHV